MYLWDKPLDFKVVFSLEFFCVCLFQKLTLSILTFDSQSSKCEEIEFLFSLSLFFFQTIVEILGYDLIRFTVLLISFKPQSSSKGILTLQAVNKAVLDCPEVQFLSFMWPHFTLLYILLVFS